MQSLQNSLTEDEMPNTINTAPKTVKALIKLIEDSTSTGTRFTVLHLNGFEAAALLDDLLLYQDKQ